MFVVSLHGNIFLLLSIPKVINNANVCFLASNASPTPRTGAVQVDSIGDDTTSTILLNGRSFKQSAIFLAEGLHSSLGTDSFKIACGEAFDAYLNVASAIMADENEQLDLPHMVEIIGMTA
ncbi:hypothetical protein GQX74_002654 [Glossina fuscipes]|nr:hypothetical protein GQX74_002654 [Glossina fuscipes]